MEMYLSHAPSMAMDGKLENPSVHAYPVLGPSLLKQWKADWPERDVLQ